MKEWTIRYTNGCMTLIETFFPCSLKVLRMLRPRFEQDPKGAQTAEDIARHCEERGAQMAESIARHCEERVPQLANEIKTRRRNKLTKRELRELRVLANKVTKYKKNGEAIREWQLKT